MHGRPAGGSPLPCEQGAAVGHKQNNLELIAPHPVQHPGRPTQAGKGLTCIPCTGPLAHCTSDIHIMSQRMPPPLSIPGDLQPGVLDEVDKPEMWCTYGVLISPNQVKTQLNKVAQNSFFGQIWKIYVQKPLIHLLLYLCCCSYPSFGRTG